MLAPEPQEQSAQRAAEPRVKVLERTAACRKRAPIHIGEPWGAARTIFDGWKWRRDSVFVANNNGASDAGTHECGRPHDGARVQLGDQFDGRPWKTEKLRLRGVCESVTSEKGESIAGTLWVPDARQISLLDFTDNDWNGLEPVPMFDLVPSNPNLAWGRKVLVRGTILEHDPEVAMRCQFRAMTVSTGIISDDGTNWDQVGVPVSIVHQQFRLCGSGDFVAWPIIRCRRRRLIEARPAVGYDAIPSIGAATNDRHSIQQRDFYHSGRQRRH